MTTEQKGIGYQGIRATEAFEHENTRIDLKYCYFWGKWKTMSDYRDTRDPRDIFRPLIDGFTDKPVVQCDVQVAENTFRDDSK